jgi:hypothetical protein
MKKETVKNEFSFEKGFMQARQMDADKIKEEIMNALEVKTVGSWSLRLRGITEPRVSEARAIEEVFSRYGITDIWGGA